jgi:hypothetical protein
MLLDKEGELMCALVANEFVVDNDAKFVAKGLEKLLEGH